MNLPSNTSVAICILVVPLAAGTIVNAQGPILGRFDAATTEGVLLPAPGLQPASGQPVRQVSVNEAVELALDHNLGIRSERFNPQIQDMVVADARSVWLPNLSVDVLRNNATNPASSFLAGGDDQIVDKLFNNVFTVNQQMPWAGRDVHRRVGRIAVEHDELLQLVRPDSAIEHAAVLYPALAPELLD